jgi:hypothetical protein
MEKLREHLSLRQSKQSSRQATAMQNDLKKCPASGEEAFFASDLTQGERSYTSQYVCSDFARTLHNNAEAAGIKCAWVGCSFTRGIGHAFNEFQTTDKGIVYIDDTGVPGGSTYQDKILNCNIGQPLTVKYLFRSGNIGSMGTVDHLDVFW